MELTEPMSIEPQRHLDRSIMELLAPLFTKTELRQLNKIRISMQILTLADITMQNGRTLLPNIRLGVSYRRSSLTWPRQPFVKKILPLWERVCTILQNQLHSNTLGHWKSIH